MLIHKDSVNRVLFAADVIAKCLSESGNDVESGFAAAEYILSHDIPDTIPGGLADGKPDEDFDPKELARGILVELEHTDDFAIAKEIAKDHLTEDKNYYKKLAKAGLSINASLAHDIHNPRAQAVLNKSLQSVKGMTAAAREDLSKALEKEDGGQAIVEFVERYRIQLARLLTQTQLAALLEGAQEVASNISTLETDLQALGPIPQPTFEHEDSVHLATIEEATRSLAERNILTKPSYNAIEAAARAKSFTVAGVDAQETLTKIRDTLADNVRKGADYATFRKEILDAVDGGTFLSDAHQETVFRTNVQTAFSDGQMSVLLNPLVRTGFPYASYDSIHDDRARAEHNSLDKSGIGGSNVYRTDDPVFKLFRPPWDYNCRCSWAPMTVRQAAEAGVAEAQEWMETGREPSEPAHVAPPPFEPPAAFARGGEAMLSIQLSRQPMATFDPAPMAHDGPALPPTTWARDDYPRDNAGRFVSKYVIAEATRDHNKLTELRESIPQEEHRKLDHAVATLQSGGTVHHPDEPPEMGINQYGVIANWRWAMYAEDCHRHEAWVERDADRKTCKNILHLATRNLRSKTTQNLDHIDQLLADAGIDDRSTRDIERARYRLDNGRITKEDLEVVYEDVIEFLYQKLECECEDDPEPLKPIEPNEVTSAMFSTEDWVSDPGPRQRNRWRNTKTGRVDYGDRPGSRGGRAQPQSNEPSKPRTTLPLPRPAGGPVIPRTVPHQQPTSVLNRANTPQSEPPIDSTPRPMVSAPPVPVSVPKIQTPLPSVRRHEGKSDSPQSDVVRRLETAPVTSTTPLNGGANGSYKVVIDGVTCVWKPSDEERFLRIGINEGTYYKREAAAYSIANLVGLDHLVPVTVEKEHNGKVGSVQHWVEDSAAAFLYKGDKYDGEEDLKLAAAFDYLIGNTDRHAGNWMLDQGEGKLHLIDHGLAFPFNDSDEFLSYLFDKCAESNLEVPDVISKWDESRITEELQAHNIEDNAIKGVLKRLSDLKKVAGSGTFSQLVQEREIV